MTIIIICIHVQLGAINTDMHVKNPNLHEVFRALSDPLRIRIVRLLLSSDTEMCLCELADSLKEPEYKLSRQMKFLKRAGLITAVKDANWVYHGLVMEKQYVRHIFKTLREYSEDEELFSADLARFHQRLKLRVDGRCRRVPQWRPESGDNARRKLK